MQHMSLPAFGFPRVRSGRSMSQVCHWIERTIRIQTFLQIDGWSACQLFLPSPNILHLYFLRAQLGEWQKSQAPVRHLSQRFWLCCVLIPFYMYYSMSIRIFLWLTENSVGSFLWWGEHDDDTGDCDAERQTMSKRRHRRRERDEFPASLIWPPFCTQTESVSIHELQRKLVRSST